MRIAGVAALTFARPCCFTRPSRRRTHPQREVHIHCASGAIPKERPLGRFHHGASLVSSN